jgi:hypothetical protein
VTTVTNTRILVQMTYCCGGGGGTAVMKTWTLWPTLKYAYISFSGTEDMSTLAVHKQMPCRLLLGWFHLQGTNMSPSCSVSWRLCQLQATHKLWLAVQCTVALYCYCYYYYKIAFRYMCMLPALKISYRICNMKKALNLKMEKVMCLCRRCHRSIKKLEKQCS